MKLWADTFGRNLYNTVTRYSGSLLLQKVSDLSQGAPAWSEGLFPRRDRTPNIRAVKGPIDHHCQSSHTQMGPQEVPLLGQTSVDSEIKNIVSVQILGSQGQD